MTFVTGNVKNETKVLLLLPFSAHSDNVSTNKVNLSKPVTHHPYHKCLQREHLSVCNNYFSVMSQFMLVTQLRSNNTFHERHQMGPARMPRELNAGVSNVAAIA